MAQRTSYAESQIPTPASAVPYVEFADLARVFGGFFAEAFVGAVTGAAAAGGDLVNIPFEPAVVFISEATAPLMQIQLPSATKVDINMITGADASVAIPDATQEADDTWTIALPTTLAPDGDVVTCLCLGIRNDNASL